MILDYDKVNYEKWLLGCNALVTAGAQGCGKEIALLFAHHGAAVAIADCNADAGRETEAELKKIQPDCFFVPADMGDMSQVDRMCGEVTARMGGKVQVLVNNAGVFEGGFLMDADFDALERMFRVNVQGTIRTTQKILPAMVASKGGNIVNIASDYAIRGNPGVSLFAATKGAVYSFTRAIAIEMGKHDIRANCILPGMNITSHGQRYIESQGSEKAEADFTFLQPIRRRGEAGDVADAALFLASQMSRFLTGEAIEVNGGITAHAHKQGMSPTRQWNIGAGGRRI